MSAAGAWPLRFTTSAPRASAQRMIDAHAHDAHLAIYERIEALEARATK